MYEIRPAQAQDGRQIRKLIWSVGINPLGLNWRRFLVAVDARGRLVGCGQIKPHADGSRELASIAVQPDARGQGVSRAIITRLLAGQPLPIYLTCRASLEGYYKRFGFRSAAASEMPAYFRRIARLAGALRTIRPGSEDLLVMVKEESGGS